MVRGSCDTTTTEGAFRCRIPRLPARSPRRRPTIVPDRARERGRAAGQGVGREARRIALGGWRATSSDGTCRRLAGAMCAATRHCVERRCRCSPRPRSRRWGGRVGSTGASRGIFRAFDFALATALGAVVESKRGFASVWRLLAVAALGVEVARSAVTQRFGSGSAKLLEQLFHQTLARLPEEPCPELLRKLDEFRGVLAHDGSVLTLSPLLQKLFPSTRTNTREACWRLPVNGATGRSNVVRYDASVPTTRGHLYGQVTAPAHRPEAHGGTRRGRGVPRHRHRVRRSGLLPGDPSACRRYARPRSGDRHVHHVGYPVGIYSCFHIGIWY